MAYMVEVVDLGVRAAVRVRARAAVGVGVTAAVGVRARAAVGKV